MTAFGDTTYLYRTIRVDEPTELDLSLGSDDTITVWVNRKEVLKNKAQRGATADQGKADHLSGDRRKSPADEGL